MSILTKKKQILLFRRVWRRYQGETMCLSRNLELGSRWEKNTGKIKTTQSNKKCVQLKVKFAGQNVSKGSDSNRRFATIKHPLFLWLYMATMCGLSVPHSSFLSFTSPPCRRPAKNQTRPFLRWESHVVT